MEKLLTAKEVAELLNCHSQSVYRSKTIPRVHIPGVGVRFKEEDIQKIIQQRTINASPHFGQIDENNSIPMQFNPYLGINLKEEGGIGGMPKGKSKARYNLGYGAIYQRKTKTGKIRWYLDYRDADQRRIQKVAKNAQTKEDAVLALRTEVARAFEREFNIERKKEQIRLKEFVEIYIRDYAMVRKRSWKSDFYYFHANIVPYFRDALLSEVCQSNIEKYVVKRIKDGVKKSSINRELACLSKLFCKAIDWGYLTKNPVSRIKFFSEKNNLKERVLSDEEEKVLLESCSEHLKPIIITALQTGMRKGEILGLKWQDVSLPKREIKLLETKSNRVRIVPINERLYLELVMLKKINKCAAFVFLNPETGKPLKDVKRAFRGACRRASIIGLRFHDLRHTFASRLVQEGVDLITVKDLLGHSSVKVTERYTHSNQNQKKKAVEALIRKSSEKAGNLLHNCDMKERKDPRKTLIDSFSVN